jgi:hypothetical protein
MQFDRLGFRGFSTDQIQAFNKFQLYKFQRDAVMYEIGTSTVIGRRPSLNLFNLFNDAALDEVGDFLSSGWFSWLRSMKPISTFLDSFALISMGAISIGGVVNAIIVYREKGLCWQVIIGLFLPFFSIVLHPLNLAMPKRYTRGSRRTSKRVWGWGWARRWRRHARKKQRSRKPKVAITNEDSQNDGDSEPDDSTSGQETQSSRPFTPDQSPPGYDESGEKGHQKPEDKSSKWNSKGNRATTQVDPQKVQPSASPLPSDSEGGYDSASTITMRTKGSSVLYRPLVNVEDDQLQAMPKRSRGGSSLGRKSKKAETKLAERGDES